MSDIFNPSGTGGSAPAGSTGQIQTNGGGGTFAAIAAGQLPGTTTNDNAAVGKVGEYIASQIFNASAVSLTNATPANVTSISLTAGDWDVNGIIYFKDAGTITTLTLCAADIQTTSGGSYNGDTTVSAISYSVTMQTNQILSFAMDTRRISISSTTTYFLNALSNFSVGSIAAYGTIRARRIR